MSRPRWQRRIWRAAREEWGGGFCTECGGTPSEIDPESIHALMLIGFEGGADCVASSPHNPTGDVCPDIGSRNGMPVWSLVGGLCRWCLLPRLDSAESRALQLALFMAAATNNGLLDARASI